MGVPVSELQSTMAPMTDYCLSHLYDWRLAIWPPTHFYRATAMLTAVYAVVVCLCVCVCVRECVCVCLSVTLRYCIKTTKRRITQIMPYDSAKNLVLWYQSSRRNSKRITPYGGDKCRWGGLKLVTFDEKRAITRKRYKIDAYFLLKSNRKSYVLYKMAMFPMTLGDP